MLEIALLKEALSQPKRIVITTHHKPDGDAIGSSLGLYAYLLQKGHQVKVVSPTDYPTFLHWLPNHAEVLIYTEKPAASEQYIADADFIFCLDFNALARINELGEIIRQAKGIKVLIDHHLEPEGFEDYRHWSVHVCATAQLIFDFIARIMGDKHLINKQVATCLYTGIVTDSGSFKFATSTAEVHHIAADLIDAGAENAKIHQLLYNNFSENRLRFLGHCLSNNLEVLSALNVALIVVPREDILRHQLSVGDTEGLVSYALSIKGIRLAALIIDRTSQIKLSLRSIGAFPANEVCRKYFSGGGHLNAAGGSSNNKLEDVVAKFKAILPEYKNFLVQQDIINEYI